MPGFSTKSNNLSSAQDDYNRAELALQQAVGSGMSGSAAYYAAQNAVDQARGRLTEMSASGNAGNAANDPAARAEENRKKLYGLAEGRLGELKADPTDALVLQQLTARANGSQNPYDETTRNALLTGQSDQAAQAAANQQAQLDRSGLRATDPAYQSRLAEIQSQRQQSNQAANLNINQQANVANYGAQQQALAGLGSYNMSHNAAITDQGRYLGNLYQQEQFRNESAPVQQSLPNFQQYSQYQAQPQQAYQVPQYQPAAASAQQTQQSPAIRATSSQTGQVYGPPSPYNPIINGQQAMRTQQPQQQPQQQPTQPQIPYNRYGPTQIYGLDNFDS